MARNSEKMAQPKTIRALSFWHDVTLTALKHLPLDLSARQTAILLHVHLVSTPHSIKSLASSLAISKPAVCRAVDALEAARLLKRGRDKADGRNVLIQRTAKGAAYLSDFAEIISSVSKGL